MKNITKLTMKHSNMLLYLMSVAVGCFIIFLLFSINDNTRHIVEDVQTDLRALQKDVEADHDGQDKLLLCIGQLFLEKETITEVDFENCVIETSVPPQTTGDRESAPRETPPASQPSDDSSLPSSSNSNPNSNNSQPDNSQNESEPPCAIAAKLLVGDLCI